MASILAAPLQYSIAPMEAIDLPRHDRYVRRRLLGRGGYGEVWLADDRDLNRSVAVKYLTSLTPDDLARFHREARLAAKLSHPNIVPVHDVGDRFLVMEFIDGAPAHQLPLKPREAADLIRQAAEGVAHAHAQGIIHRDLKPSNLLVAGGKAYVADFGLAKQVGTESSLSMTGDVFGTPMFMSPEQARGERLGASSDVYSLGATLYALLAGSPPFESGDVYEILRWVVERDPPPLSPRIDRDLRVIVQKAMEKEPARRYASMADLAADLGRWLAGEPIDARPASLAYRVRTRVRRNPWAWLGMSAALVLVGVAAGVWWKGSRREAALRRYEEARTDFHAALMAALGGDAAADTLMANFETKLAEARAIDPSFEAGWFERAQFRRLVGDEAGAMEALREGLARRPDDPVGRTEKGMALAAQYQRQTAEFGAMLQLARAQFEGRVVHDAPDASLEPVRLEALGLLESGAVEGERPWVRLARAELHLLRREFDEAIKAVDGLHYAHAKVVRGQVAEERGDIEAALGHFDAAVVTQPNFWPAHEHRARLRGRLAFAGGAESLPAALASRANWDELIAHHPDADARVGRSFIGWCLGNIAADRGEDPRPHYRGAIEDARAALALKPENLQAWANLATTYSGLSEYEAGRGDDPTESLAAAVEAYDRVLARDSSYVDMEFNRANKFLYLGRWHLSRGQDPAVAFAAAVDGAERALRKRPDDVFGLVVLSYVRGEEGDAAAARGEDADERFAESVGLARRAVRSGPASVAAARALASQLARLGRWQFERGQDSSDAFDEAEREFARTLELKPKDPDALEGRATLALFRAEAGGDPAAALEAAESPGIRAKVLRLVGERAAQRGNDPTDSYRWGLEALEGRTISAEAWNDLGLLHLRWGEWEARIPKDPTEAFDRAIDAFESAAAINPRSFEAHVNRGTALQQRSLWEAYHGGDAGASLREAAAALETALGLNPRSSSAFNNQANIFQNLGRWHQMRGDSSADAFARALDSYGRALTLNPRSWETLASRGALFDGMGRTRDALTDFEAALKLNPENRKLREWTEDARRRADDF